MKSLAKLICSAIVLFLFISSAHSQPKLWGVLPSNGITESGSVFQMELDGSNLTSIKDFVFPNCGRPRGNVLYASNGKVYGNAELSSGPYGSIIYEYDPADGSFQFVYEFFDPTVGYGESAMLCSLVEHSNGKVYGMTQHGGDHNDGQLFEFDLQTKELIVKVHFESATKGRMPVGGLTEAADGRFYGVTFEGGTHDLGVLYVYDPATNIFAALKHFDGPGIGSNPHNSPIQTPNGKLLGTTRTGGIADLGVVYEYDIASNIITKKHDFDGTNTGSFPYDKFCLASNGMFYAMTSTGGVLDKGALVEFDQTSGVVTKKLDFNGSNGRYPVGAMVEYTDGYLYGKVTHGGLEEHGVLFKYDPNSSIFTKLLDFYEDYGESAYDGLTISPDGTFFGTTWQGGLGHHGVLFEFDPSDGICQQLIHFRYAELGGIPRCDLIEASDGMVYGTTTAGGVNGSGIIFRIDPADRSFEKVFDFEYLNLGGGCETGLMEASNGLLYGLAAYGGANYDGLMFAFDPANLQYTVLHHFDENVSGSYPVGKLMQGANGSLYGVTERGGVDGSGVLFEYMLSTQTYLVLHEFVNLTSGKYPFSPVQASNGKLYGVTRWGGSYNQGVLYEFDPMAYTMNIAVDFDNLNKGAFPVGVPLEYSDNQLYGMTGHGGSDGGGVLYNYNAVNGLYTKIKNFQYSDGDGFSPNTSLMKASNDLIYGTVSMGGTQEWGLVFSFDPLGGDYAVVHDFDEYNERPLSGSLLEVETDYGIDESQACEMDFALYPNPAQEQIYLSIPEVKADVQLSIFNALGKLILNKRIEVNSNASLNTTVDISGLPPGVYTLRIQSESESGSKKLIVK